MGPEARTALLIGNYLPSLVAARSLATAGYKVIGGDGGEFSTLGQSRSCHEVWQHPPVVDEERFIDALAAELNARPEIQILLPLQEQYVVVLARRRDSMPPSVCVASPPPEIVLACMNKERMYEIARKVGVSYSPVAVAHDVESLRAAADDVGYPCVIRPGGSTKLAGGLKAMTVRSRQQLEREFVDTKSDQLSLLVQRKVIGPRHNVYFIAQDGRVVASVETRIARTDRHDGTGLAVEGVTVSPSPQLTEATRRLVDYFRYTGVGCAQFLVPAAGEPSFLEVNPRHGAASAAVEAVGLPLTIAACRLATGDGVDGYARTGTWYRTGSRYAWTSRDVWGLWRAWRQGDIDLRGFASWASAAAGAVVRADTHLTWSPRDPLPTLAVYAQWLPAGPWRRRGLTRR